MGQKEGGKPSCCGKLSKPIEYRIKDRIEEKSERAYHDHDFKSHDDKQDDAGKCCKLRRLFLQFSPHFIFLQMILLLPPNSKTVFLRKNVTDQMGMRAFGTMVFRVLHQPVFNYFKSLKMFF